MKCRCKTQPGQRARAHTAALAFKAIHQAARENRPNAAAMEVNPVRSCGCHGNGPLGRARARVRVSLIFISLLLLGC